MQAEKGASIQRTGQLVMTHIVTAHIVMVYVVMVYVVMVYVVSYGQYSYGASMQMTTCSTHHDAAE